MITQREGDDCTICAIAMATGLTYEAVMATARVSEGGYRYQGKPGTMSPKGVLIDLGFEARRVMIGASIRQAVWQAFLWGRRAVLSMPSLNGFDGHHDVYWDGHAICDPTTKTPYAPAALGHATPLWAVVIDERAAALPAPAEARSVSAPNTFEVGKPAPYFCPACQAVPRAGYCKLAGCPTAAPSSEQAEGGR